jgi:hypothetical protein
MSPFTPFFTEAMYQNLRKSLPPGAPESVHFFEFPKVGPRGPSIYYAQLPGRTSGPTFLLRACSMEQQLRRGGGTARSRQQVRQGWAQQARMGSIGAAG